MLLILLLLAPSILAVAPPPLYKCCPHGYALNDSVCVKHFTPQPDVSWFPRPAIAASSPDIKSLTIAPEIEPGRDFFEPCDTSLAEFKYHTIGLDSEQKLHVTHEGELHVTDGSTVVFSSYTWCVDHVVNDEGDLEGTRIFSCPCLRKTCVSLCCESNELIDYERTGPSLKEWCMPDLGHYPLWGERNITSHTTSGDISNFVFKRYDLSEYLENCFTSQPGASTFREIFSPILMEDFALRDDGTVTSSKYTLPKEKFCLGQTLRGGRSVTVAFFCDKSEMVISRGTALSQSVLGAIGAVISLLTLLVHAASPKLRKGVKGASLMMHCACMVVVYLCVACKPLAWSWNTRPCLSLAAVIQFSLLSAFCWLNIRAIIIHSTFRSLGSMLDGTSRRSLLWYSLHALGVPAVISGVTWWAAVSPHRPFWVLRPNVNFATCWFGSGAGWAVYYSAPMGLLLVINLVLLITTARHILVLRRKNSVLKEQGRSSLDSDYKRFKLYAKLFILMGLTWISEVLSWIKFFDRCFWYIFNFRFILYPMLVFVFFCCKKKVWAELLRKTIQVCRCGRKRGEMSVFYTKTDKMKSHEMSTTQTNNSVDSE